MRLQVVVEGEGWSVVLEEFRGTGYEWKQVRPLPSSLNEDTPCFPNMYNVCVFL